MVRETGPGPSCEPTPLLIRGKSVIVKGQYRHGSRVRHPMVILYYSVWVFRVLVTPLGQFGWYDDYQKHGNLSFIQLLTSLNRVTRDDENHELSLYCKWSKTVIRSTSRNSLFHF